MLFRSFALISPTPSNVPVTSAICLILIFCTYRYLIFRILNVRDVCLDCLDLIVITFKPPASRSHTYCDCNPIRAFETFYISKKLISKTSRFWMFWYKRGCNWLSAIKGIALWSRGFSCGSLFNSFVTKPRRLVQICTTPA